eukprot:scaffold417168_cov37-Prasinocladus_malaysianus.AAC.1
MLKVIDLPGFIMNVGNADCTVIAKGQICSDHDGLKSNGHTATAHNGARCGILRLRTRIAANR